MSKKRAQKRKNTSTKKYQRKNNKKRKTPPQKQTKPKTKLPPPQEEIKPLQTQNIATSIKIEKNQNQEIKEEKDDSFINYYSKTIINTFDTYSSGSFEILLKDESKKENILQINEEILSYFGITKELRKYAFKYLAEILERYEIPIKFYFKTVIIFDSFLINFSKIYKNDKKLCSDFFMSKNDNNFSSTKLILFTLCCFYIINQIYNNKNFELKCLVNWNNKNEMTYDELNDLAYDILEVIDCEINSIGIYDFINIFVFDLNKRIKIISDDNIFINCYNKNVNYLAMKIEQDITLNDILPSMKALGVIMFSIEYSKFLTEKYVQNEKINILVENWVKNVQNLLINYNYDDIKRIIQWLNNYINNH